VVYYGGMQPDVCPRCASTTDVRTIQDLANMFGQAPGNPMQRPGPYQQPGYGPGQQGGYQAEPFYGPESGYGQGPGPTPIRGYDQSREYGADSAGQEVADMVIGLAGRFIGKAIKNRMQRVAEEKILPTLNARAQQSGQEIQAIADRYPELRACMKDQVIFLSGGTATVPMSEIPNITQVTLAQADAVVARLRSA
jgi:hypothetical protein